MSFVQTAVSVFLAICISFTHKFITEVRLQVQSPQSSSSKQSREPNSKSSCSTLERLLGLLGFFYYFEQFLKV